MGIVAGIHSVVKCFNFFVILNKKIMELVMDRKIIISNLVLCFVVCLWGTEAWAFADPIVHKVNAVSSETTKIGKGVIGVSAICAIIMLGLGQTQWRWFLYILIAGVALTASHSIIEWITH